MSWLRKSGAISQIVLGGVALCLVGYFWVVFAPRAREALHQLDKMAEAAEVEIDATLDVLQEYQSIAIALRSTGESYTATVKSAEETAQKLATSLELWAKATDRTENVVKDASSVFRLVSTLRYPAGLRVKNTSINILMEKVTIPKGLEVTYNAIPEKARLESAASELSQVAIILDRTESDFGQVSGMLKNEMLESLRSSNASIEKVDGALEKFALVTIPTLVAQLSQQKDDLNHSRGVFVALEDLILPAALFLLVISVCIILGGVINLAPLRQATTSGS